MLHRVQARRGGKHPALERLTRRRRGAARLGPRLGVDGEVDDRVLDGLVRGRPLAGAHGEDQALPANRLANGRFEPKRLCGHLVQRLQHGDVVAGAADRSRDRLLRDLFLRGGGGGHLARGHRLRHHRRRRRHRGGGRFLGGRSRHGRGRRFGGDRRRRCGGLGRDHAGQGRTQGHAKPRAANGQTGGAARDHGYSGVQAS